MPHRLNAATASSRLENVPMEDPGQSRKAMKPPASESMTTRPVAHGGEKSWRSSALWSGEKRISDFFQNIAR
jgi:hypothetical protein